MHDHIQVTCPFHEDSQEIKPIASIRINWKIWKMLLILKIYKYILFIVSKKIDEKIINLGNINNILIFFFLNLMIL